MKNRSIGTTSHVVFTLKNSRYYYQRVKRKNPKGYITATFPYLIDKEEDDIIEVLCEVAVEIKLDLIAFNFCSDHVHCIVRTESEYLSKILLLWKGKTSYNYHNRFNSRSSGCSSAINEEHSQGLWAKSFYQRVLKDETELCNAVNYIATNRKKHGLPPLSQKSIQLIRNTINIMT